MKTLHPWLLTLTLTLAGLAPAAEVTPEEILKRYDAVMGPESFESNTLMSATRADGTTRTYGMKMLKSGTDKFRIWFSEPAAVKGQEILRVGDNLWLYLPNLKRATRIASRDDFQGGDFNNADVLRVNYQADYDAKLGSSELPETYLLELKAKHTQTSYDVIKLWVRKADLLPVRAQYFGTSGQMLRSAEFSDYRELDKGFTRPAKVVMQNELVKARRSEMVIKDMKLNVNPPAQRFIQADLGR